MVSIAQPRNDAVQTAVISCCNLVATIRVERAESTLTKD